MDARADDTEIERAQSHEDVLTALREDLGEGGFQRELDDLHSVTFVARGRRLIVSFETLEDTLETMPNGLPIGLDFAEDKSWSLLHFTSRACTWFRAPEIYAFMDDLVDEMFFEEFDQVLFYGAGAGGYAAAAYSVAAPGARVLAIAPQASLDRHRTAWDHRYPQARNMDFVSRYGYAPDLMEGAATGYIVYDPYTPLDHVHASLFQGPNIVPLKCRHFGSQIAQVLADQQVLHRMIEMAATGGLLHQRFYRLMRIRHRHTRYLRALAAHSVKQNTPLRTAVICDYVLQNLGGGPFFRRTLRAAKEQLAEAGTLPAWLDP